MLSAISDSIKELSIDDDGEWPWDKHGLITATHQILELIVECDKQILGTIKKVIQKLS